MYNLKHISKKIELYPSKKEEEEITEFLITRIVNISNCVHIHCT